MKVSDVPLTWANGAQVSREDRLAMSLLRVAGCGCELPLLRDRPRCKLCDTRVTLEAPTQAEIHAAASASTRRTSG